MIYKILTAILGAIVIYYIYKVYYNVYLSPLKDIPGPIELLLFPPLRHLYNLDFKLFLSYANYHKKYGKVVRIGWNTVIFNSEDSMKQIYLDTSFIKSDFYKRLQAFGFNVFTMTDKEQHKKRKRILMPSFNIVNIKKVEPKILKDGIELLLSAIEEESSTSGTCDIYKLIKLTTLDIIGSISFGTKFNALKSGEASIQNCLDNGNMFLLLEKVFPLLKIFPNYFYNKSFQFAMQCVKDAKKDTKHGTILNSLIQAEDPDTGHKLSDEELMYEAVLQIFAGSDSTANAITWLLYFLLKNRKKYNKLVKEIKEFYDINKGFSGDNINRKDMIYLKACIKESMRLIPGVGDALWRVVPKNGKLIGGYFIPEGIVVGSSIYTLQNDENLWGNDATEFNPERWIIDDNVISNADKYMPFSIGNRACLGRNLALTMMELIICNLIHKFEWNLLNKHQVITPMTVAFTAPREGHLNLKCSLRND